MTAPRVGFIGAGKMATALASGICRAGVTTPDRIIAADTSAAARESFTKTSQARTADSNRAVVEAADVVVIAVKPQYVREVLAEIKPFLRETHLVVSIAAGIPLRLIQEILGDDCKLVRVMPNTPCLIGASASAYCLGGTAGTAEGELISRLLGAVGLAVALPETQIDAVTGLSGSGPAFVYLMIEALSDGGVRMGLPRDVATRLAAQTVMGAARMVLETGEHPGALKDAVASPGGTTIAGLHALETGGLRGTLMNAVQAATLRSQELSK